MARNARAHIEPIVAGDPEIQEEYEALRLRRAIVAQLRALREAAPPPRSTNRQDRDYESRSKDHQQHPRHQRHVAGGTRYPSPGWSRFNTRSRCTGGLP